MFGTRCVNARECQSLDERHLNPNAVDMIGTLACLLHLTSASKACATVFMFTLGDWVETSLHLVSRDMTKPAA